MKRIAALVPNKLDFSPGQRLRIEAWSQHLSEYGWTIDFYPFESEKLHEVLYKPGNHLKKISYTISCYREQLKRILSKPAKPSSKFTFGS